MTTNLDLGARCDRHVGEAFAVRCDECEQANRDLEQARSRERHEQALQRNVALGITPDRRPATTHRLSYRSRR